MYLRRKADRFFSEWKSSPSHKPLIVRGARQVGKIESILHFARENYENVININFALEKKYLNFQMDGRFEVICSGSMLLGGKYRRKQIQGILFRYGAFDFVP